MSLIVWVFCTLLAVVFAQTFKVDPGTGLFVDEMGRRKVFHGVNVVEKLAPFLPTQSADDVIHSLNDNDIANLRNWGMNAVRLGVMWTAVMPSPGVVNMTYLDQVADLITKLAANNIYTIVDAHQDVLSPFMCGEGIPNWAFELAMETVGFNTSDPKKAFPAPQNFTLARNPDGTPVLSDCQKYEFFSFYTTYQNEAAFNALYHYSAVIDAFAQSWAAVAARLKSVPGIIGYELLNEPWPAGKHPFSDNDALMVLYTTLANSIRAHDNRTIIMFEPIVIDSYLSVINRTTTFPVGGIEGLEHADRQIYAYHLYCVNNSTGAPEPWLFCKYLVQDMWSMIKRDLKLLQLGGFLTEFGAVGNDGDSIKLLHEHASFADSFFQSWTYWTFKGFDDITTQNAATESFFNTDGSLQTAKVTALARTYAQTISGQPASMSFDPSSRVFELVYVTFAPSSSHVDITTIFVNLDLVYTQGVLVTVSPASAATAQLTQFGIIEITHAHNLAANTNITVQIQPKA